ncbi:unnamed protein product, partial [Gadus morhua 'NCC']
MSKTFGYRRQEIVHKQPSIEDMLERWPALFQMEEINAEFMRVTTVLLQTKFLAQLDKHTSKLLEVIRSKGGRVKEQTKATLQVLDETVDITIRRECIFKSLMIYLGEPVHHLIKECQDMQENEAAIAIVSGNEDIKIVIDGTEVLREFTAPKPVVHSRVAISILMPFSFNEEFRALSLEPRNWLPRNINATADALLT